MRIQWHYQPLSEPCSDGLKKINEIHVGHTSAALGGPPPLPQKPRPDLPEGISVWQQKIGGVPCLCVSGKNSKPCAILYIHGGGFAYDSAEEGLHLLVHTAVKCGFDGFSVDYTLMPKGLYPTQLEECAKVYYALHEQGYEKIFISGFSAGAQLSLALGFYLRKHNLPAPIGIAAFSPPLDFTGFVKPEFIDYLSKDNSLGRIYANGANLYDPCLSPLFGDFNGYPPLLIMVGTGESLVTSCKNLVEKLQREKTDCDVTISLWEGMMHGFVLDSCFYPEAFKALEYAGDFIVERLSS